MLYVFITKPDILSKYKDKLQKPVVAAQPPPVDPEVARLKKENEELRQRQAE